VDLIRSCGYSLHDLSRVKVDLRRPRTPRFNMPFELGLTVINALVRVKRRPTVRQIMDVYGTLEDSSPGIMAKAGSGSPFGARVFVDLVVSAN
jgi:hypothetical protein